jgi:hypothetical protein
MLFDVVKGPGRGLARHPGRLAPSRAIRLTFQQVAH